MEASGEAQEKSDTTVTMEYSEDNRLLSYNGEKVKYDEEGNMTYGPLDGKMTEFVYDCRNRLIKAGNTQYGYDAENNRIAVTKDGVTTKYVVDSNCEYSQVLTAITDDSVITYIYGDGLIAQESEQDYITYHYNQVGSTTALTDEKGIVIETYEYSPYGDILDGDSSLTMFLYNGKYGVASDDNGLYYMRARYYDISIKRFVNQDVVIGHLDATSSLNRYAYCEGNPVSFLDPFGLDRIDTTPIHDFLYIMSLAANIITLFAPEVGYPLGVAISAVDGIVSCFDLGQDIVYGDFWDVLGDITSIVLDIIGAISSINANSFDQTRRIMPKAKDCYEGMLKKWDQISNESTGAASLPILKRLFEWMINNIEEALYE